MAFSFGEKNDELYQLATSLRKLHSLSESKRVYLGNTREIKEGHLSDESRLPKIGLFVTCLVDFYRPSVARATLKLLKIAGYTNIDVPLQQSCCGQPAYNSGDDIGSRKIARQVIEAFSDFDYVVLPSGSCTGMIHHYPELFAGDAPWQAKATELVEKTWELCRFLLEVAKIKHLPTEYRASCTYHDSCTGLRELTIHGQPRSLMGMVSGLEIREMQDADVCCGFGGLFCVKYPEISERMVSDKVQNIENSTADTLVGGDLGCLLNMAGRLRHAGKSTRVFHVAEILAGCEDESGIAGPEGTGSAD